MPHRYSDLWRSLAQALLGAPEFTPAEVAAEAGVDLQQARRLWRALGFPAVPDDHRVFTRTDVAMLRAAAGLLEQEVAEPEVLLQLTRVTGQALARVAEAQVAAAADRLGDLLRAADTAEYVDENNTSKWCRLSRESFAVGALARFNNNHRFLHPKAREVASGLGLEAVCHNPFMNNVAQLVECVHATHDAIRLIEELVEDGPAETMAPVKPKPGQGAGAVEVPRGILYHHYEYDGEGRIVRANCIIPTTQNNANIQHDLAGLVERFAVAGMTDEKLELLCSMLVRAYDPCISCSVH